MYWFDAALASTSLIRSNIYELNASPGWRPAVMIYFSVNPMLGRNCILVSRYTPQSISHTFQIFFSPSGISKPPLWVFYHMPFVDLLIRGVAFSVLLYTPLDSIGQQK